jgi:hypothetical protein
MRNVILNSSNIVPGSNNSRFSFTFPSTAEFKTDSIALSNITMSVSWDNINSTYNNNFFSYIWYDNVGPSTHVVNIPDGFYELPQLNAFLQFTMIQNNHYLIDGNGDYVYYLEMAINFTSYAFEIRCDPIPTALPGGWTNPGGMTFPAVASTPQFVFPATNIQTLLGFPAGTYPAATQATTYNLNSPNVPQITDVANIIVLCSLLNNKFQYPNTILFSFVPLGGGGANLNITPPEYVFVDIQDGYYPGFEIQLVNQNFQPLVIKDPQMLIGLIFKKQTIPAMLK